MAQDHAAAAAPLVLDWAAGARWLGFVGSLTLVGVVALRPLVRRRWSGAAAPAAASYEVRATWFGRLAAVALVVAVAARLVAQSRGLLDPDEVVDAALLNQVAFASNWGGRWLWQAATALLALAAFCWLPRRSGWMPATLAVALVFVAMPLTGHALVSPLGPVAGITVHTLHFTGGAVWLGSLLLLLVAALPALGAIDPAGRPAALADLVQSFSPMALTGAGLAVAAGVVLSLSYVGLSSAIWSTSYGRVLLAKVGVLAVIMGLGALHWRRVGPRLDQPGMVRSFAWSGAAEAVLAVGLLGLSALLVALPAPRV